MQPTPIKGYADTSAGQLHFRRVEGVGSPVILLHRTPASSHCFESMLGQLAGRRSTIALDTPGFGQSFLPEGQPSAVDYARWFLEAIDALHIDDFHLCAHHTGTHFAVELALLAPQRVRSLLLNGLLYADAQERADMLAGIGSAQRIDAEGQYLSSCWALMRGLFPRAELELVHRETLGALAAIDGRDQAFGAILAQDFAARLAELRCPIKIVQSEDDPLRPMLDRVARKHPQLSISLLGPAGLAAPEYQAEAYANALLAFTQIHEPIVSSPMNTPLSSRRFELRRSATSFELHQTQQTVPKPGPGQLLIRVHAVSLNRRDLMVRELSYPVGDANHFTPLSDAAGEVLAVGEGVSRFKPGDRVCSTFFQNWSEGRISLPAMFSALGSGGAGVLADHIVLGEQGVLPMPGDWSYEQAACLPCAGVTAWSALMRLGQLQRGDWVLVLGTGGVAMFALQLAVAAGAKVAVLSSSDEKLARARALGASVAINYREQPQWAAAVREASQGGVQHVVELGGVGTLEQSIASLGIGGHVALIGALAGFGGDISGAALVSAALRVSAVMVGSQADHRALTAFMVEHGLKPVIDSVYDLAAIDAAYARAGVGGFGKVVVKLS